MVAQDATSLRRGLAILEALADHVGPEEPHLGVVRIAELVGREKSQVSRTLKTLVEHGYVARDPRTRGYRLGWQAYALAARSGPMHLQSAGATALNRLVGEIGETAHLSVLHGAEVLTVLSEASPSAIHAADWTGRTDALTCTSSGRALLFDHDRDAFDRLLADVPWPSAGPSAPRDATDLWQRLERARALGCAIADEESEALLVACAAPVRDFRGRTMAAINVSGPKYRLDPRLAEVAGTVRTVAAGLSRELGYPEPAQLEARAG